MKLKIVKISGTKDKFRILDADETGDGDRTILDLTRAELRALAIKIRMVLK